MMSLLRRLWPAALLPFLAGCFVSEESLIEAEAAVLPAEDEIIVCLAADDPCLTLQRQDDGYLAEAPNPEEEDLLVRFAPLIQAGGRQVFIAEAGLQTEDGIAYTYGLARRLPAPDERGATMQIAALDCEELDDAVLGQFEAEGGTIGAGKVTECQPVSLDRLKETLLTAHRAGLATDAWWQAHAEDL